MNDLRELRETLDSHATLDDRAATARVVAVHQRVRGVRRRRAGVGVAAVAALAAVAVGVTLPHDQGEPSPADATTLPAPQTMTSLGYTYDLSSSDLSTTIEVKASDQPQLISWGTEGGAGDVVRIKAPDGEKLTSQAAAFDDFYLVLPGEEGTLRIKGADGDVRIATYTLDDQPPAGVTSDGSTFRALVGGWDLLEAAFAHRGTGEVSFEVTLPEGPLRMSWLCTGLPKGYWVNYAIDGQSVQYADHVSCADPDVFDPAAGEASIFEPGAFGKPGETVPVRMWVSATRDGELLPGVDPGDLSDLRMGLAFHEADPGLGPVDTDEPEPVMESGGHTWTQTELGSGSGTGDLMMSTRGESLLMITSETSVATTYQVSIDGRVVSRHQTPGGAEASVTGFGEIRVPVDAKQIKVEIVSGGNDATQTAVGVYLRTD